MARSFSAHAVITLPRLTALGMARLLQELLTAAKALGVPPAWLAPDVAELGASYDALHAVLTRRLTGEAVTPGIRAADSAEDRAFSALFEWLTGWARLPADRHPEALDAQAVLQAIYPQGRSFLTIRPADEWQEAELRLQLIANRGYDQLLAKLGGQPFFDELHFAHDAYGKALGITTVKASVDAPAVREALDDALEVVRAYVLRVSAHVRAKDPASGVLAEHLLAPLVNWRDLPTEPAPAEPVEPEPVA